MSAPLSPSYRSRLLNPRIERDASFQTAPNDSTSSYFTKLYQTIASCCSYFCCSNTAEETSSEHNSLLPGGSSYLSAVERFEDLGEINTDEHLSMSAILPPEEILSNLSLPNNYEESIRKIIQSEYGEFIRPSAGGGGGPTLLIPNQFFIKFNLNMNEFIGNELFQLLGERVPQSAIMALTKNEVQAIHSRFMDENSFQNELAKLSQDKDELQVMVMPVVGGMDFHNLYKVIDIFLKDPENLNFLATELGRIAVKDFVIQIGDRMLGGTNPGNIMISFSEPWKIDTSQRLVLIDNVFNCKFSKKLLFQKSKQQILTLLRDKVEQFLNACSNRIEVSPLYQSINDGILQGLEEVHEYLKKDVKVNETLLVKHKIMLQNIRILLQKMK